MPKYSIPIQQIPDTIVNDLTAAGLLGPGSAVGTIDRLKTFDDESLIRFMIYAHELKEITMAVAEKQKANQRRQKGRGSLFGKLTGLLRPAHVAKGYYLVEDEDFLYLYMPDQEMPPIIFNARTTGLSDVIKTICRLEGEEC